MRIVQKFIITLMVILVLIRLTEGIFTVRRETYRLNVDIQRDTELLGRILKNSVSNIWLESGSHQALKMIDSFNLHEHPVQISWVPYDGSNNLKDTLSEELLGKLLDGDVVSNRHSHRESGKINYSYIPLEVSNVRGAIKLTENLEDRSRYVQHALIRETFIGVLVVIVNGFTILLLGILVIGRPLGRLQERVKDIGEGNLSDRIVLRGHDELSTLARGLNEMCEKLSASQARERAGTKKRLESLEQIRHMDRLTTIGRLASGVAHELGTPLNVIAGRAGMIADDKLLSEPKKIQKHANTIRSKAYQMTTIIQSLLNFARQTPPRRVKVNGLDIVRQSLELIDSLGYKIKVNVETEGEKPSFVAYMDPVQIQQVVTNLIENAIQASTEKSCVTVNICSNLIRPPSEVEASMKRYLQIIVIDEGGGIEKENLSKVFEPFFTTKGVGKGTGLGLSITYGIVLEHGGWIDVVSEVGKGSIFTVNIPQETL